MASVVYNDTPMAPGMSQDLILTVDPSKAQGEVLADLTISCEATTTVQESHAAGAELLVGNQDTCVLSVVLAALPLSRAPRLRRCYRRCIAQDIFAAGDARARPIFSCRVRHAVEANRCDSLVCSLVH